MSDNTSEITFPEDDTPHTPITEPLLSSENPGNLPSQTHAGFVAILGKPNVGKSTLLNTMLGVKVAPISAKPQTTRKGVRGIYTDRDSGRQLVFVDTPGFHTAHNDLGSYMNREVRNALMDVDALVWVVDLRRPPNNEDKDVARLINEHEQEVPIFLVGNKLDAAKYPEEALDLYQTLLSRVDYVRLISAMQQPDSAYALRDELLQLLPESPYYFPDNIRSDQSREDWASDIIREACMVHLRQELPYSIAVRVLEWDDSRPSKPFYIAAELWVEKGNHRMMVLGKGGKMIREIGKSARRQLEIFLDHKVFLNLEVVVRREWRQDIHALQELGYI